MYVQHVLQLAFGIIISARFINGLGFFSYGNRFEYLDNELNDNIAASDTSLVTKNWIDQPVNHFDPKENRTWKMKYYERHDLWKPGKPIYMYLGGERPVDEYWAIWGNMYELGKETNGAMYIAEHRYYGQSWPFDDFTTENFAYLSSRQALADFAKLLEYIKSLPKFKTSKVVVVGGCSYSGNLAAWMKLLYPNLVDAAIASSAPVLAKKDFYEFFEKVGDDYKQYGSPGCWDNIAKKFARYEKLLKSNLGIEILKKEKNICSDCDMTVSDNQHLFFMHAVFFFIVMPTYGFPGDIKVICDNQDKSNYGKELKPTRCNSYDFNDYINAANKDRRYRAWTYQTCTEFGYFQTSNSDKQPFTKNIPIDFYYKMCTKMFGPDFDKGRVERGVQETNKFYGGLKPNVTNVVFVNGDMDPWSKLSVLEDLSHETPAIVISQSSNCKDLFFEDDGDSDDLKAARKYIRHVIKSWIGEEDY